MGCCQGVGRALTQGFASVFIEARFTRQAVSYFIKIVSYRGLRVHPLEGFCNSASRLTDSTVMHFSPGAEEIQPVSGRVALQGRSMKGRSSRLVSNSENTCQKSGSGWKYKHALYFRLRKSQ